MCHTHRADAKTRQTVAMRTSRASASSVESRLQLEADLSGAFTANINLIDACRSELRELSLLCALSRLRRGEQIDAGSSAHTATGTSTSTSASTGMNADATAKSPLHDSTTTPAMLPQGAPPSSAMAAEPASQSRGQLHHPAWRRSSKLAGADANGAVMRVGARLPPQSAAVVGTASAGNRSPAGMLALAHRQQLRQRQQQREQLQLNRAPAGEQAPLPP